MNKQPNQIPALKRAATVLSVLGKGAVPPTSAALARATGLSQSSCYRTLKTLESLGWIRQGMAGRFELGEDLLKIVRPLMKPDQLAAAAHPHLEALVQQTELTAKLSLRRGKEQLTLARVESPRPTAVSVRVHVSRAVVLGASGGALLSGLDDDAIEEMIRGASAAAWEGNTPDGVRQRVADCRTFGYCKNIGMHPQGIDGIAAPISTAIGDAAVTLVGLRGDLDGVSLTRCAKAIKKAATAIEESCRSVLGKDTP